MHENARLKGYQINVDGKPLGGLRNPDIQKMVINNISPGQALASSVYTLDCVSPRLRKFREG